MTSSDFIRPPPLWATLSSAIYYEEVHVISVDNKQDALGVLCDVLGILPVMIHK